MKAAFKALTSLGKSPMLDKPATPPAKPGELQSNSYELVLLGSGAAGKTALCTRFSMDFFPDYYDPTIEDEWQLEFVYESLQMKLTIIDTAGQEEFSALRSQWIRTKKTFVIVFSMLDRNAFEDTDKFFEDIKEMKEPSKRSPISVVLTANKLDLKDNRKVSSEEGLKKAMEWARSTGVDVSYLEVSAKDMSLCERPFIEAIRLECGLPGNLEIWSPMEEEEKCSLSSERSLISKIRVIKAPDVAEEATKSAGSSSSSSSAKSKKDDDDEKQAEDPSLRGSSGVVSSDETGGLISEDQKE